VLLLIAGLLVRVGLLLRARACNMASQPRGDFLDCNLRFGYQCSSIRHHLVKGHLTQCGGICPLRIVFALVHTLVGSSGFAVTAKRRLCCGRSTVFSSIASVAVKRRAECTQWLFDHRCIVFAHGVDRVCEGIDFAMATTSAAASSIAPVGRGVMTRSEFRSSIGLGGSLGFIRFGNELSSSLCLRSFCLGFSGSLSLCGSLGLCGSFGFSGGLGLCGFGIGLCGSFGFSSGLGFSGCGAGTKLLCSHFTAVTVANC